MAPGSERRMCLPQQPGRAVAQHSAAASTDALVTARKPALQLHSALRMKPGLALRIQCICGHAGGGGTRGSLGQAPAMSQPRSGLPAPACTSRAAPQQEPLTTCSKDPHRALPDRPRSAPAWHPANHVRHPPRRPRQGTCTRCRYFLAVLAQDSATFASALASLSLADVQDVSNTIIEQCWNSLQMHRARICEK